MAVPQGISPFSVGAGLLNPPPTGVWAAQARCAALPASRKSSTSTPNPFGAC